MIPAISLLANPFPSIAFRAYLPNTPHSLQFSIHQLSSFFSVVKSQPLNNEYFQHSVRLFFKCRCGTSYASGDAEFGTFTSLFREMGIGFDETQVFLLKNPDLNSVSVNSLQVRIFSLRSLGFDHVALFQLVTKRPTVLSAMEIDPLLSFLKDDLGGKLELAKMKSLLSTEPKFLVGFPQKVQLLVDLGVPVDKIAHVLNNVNLSKAFCYRSVDEIERVIAFLEPFGGISLILRRPAILNFDLDNQLIPRVNVLLKLSGGNKDDTGKVLHKFPLILTYSVEHVEKHVNLLKSSANLDDQQIFRLISVFPAIVTASRERKLHPRIQFLKECGLDSGDIFKFLIRAPLFLGHSFHENIAYKLVFLVKIGYTYRTRDLAMAIGSTTRTSCENMQKVISLFLSYGFSYEDIHTMSKKQPQVLQYNHTSLEKKMKYLIEDMNRDVEELLIFPAFLGYKFDDRIKHRYELKNISGERISLNKLLTLSSERFTGKRKKKSTVIENLN